LVLHLVDLGLRVLVVGGHLGHLRVARDQVEVVGRRGLRQLGFALLDGVDLRGGLLDEGVGEFVLSRNARNGVFVLFDVWLLIIGVAHDFTAIDLVLQEVTQVGEVLLVVALLLEQAADLARVSLGRCLPHEGRLLLFLLGGSRFLRELSVAFKFDLETRQDPELAH